jgi:Tol biopolymer transport system component
MRLWWLDVEGGETVPVFEDTEQAGYGAGWSADGRWLSYIDPVRRTLRLYNLKNGRSFELPNNVGEPPVWHPQSNLLVFTNILSLGEVTTAHLFLLDPEQKHVEEISGSQVGVEDHSPTWSPDGAWLAFSRRGLGANFGRQLVMMRPGGRERANGSDMFPLTRDPQFEHAFPVWSPDDRAIVFQRISIPVGAAPPELWLVDVRNGALRKIAAPGKQAAWLP